jgi:hypothetical protein
MNIEMKTLTKSELMHTNGGGIGGLLWDIACFAVSPALGFLNLGIKAGYREAQAEAKQ